MYVKKFISFSEVLKNAHKRKLVPFFCLMVYTCIQTVPVSHWTPKECGIGWFLTTVPTVAYCILALTTKGKAQGLL